MEAVRCPVCDKQRDRYGAFNDGWHYLEPERLYFDSIICLRIWTGDQIIGDRGVR